MMTEIQKQFEEWAEKSGFNLKVVFPLIGDASADNAIYANERTRSAWQAWQASRAAVVVKLLQPEFRGWVSHETIEGYKAAIDDVKYALDDAEVNYE